MTATEHIKEKFKEYANRHKALKASAGKENFLFIPDPENSKTLIESQRNKLSFPFLALEFPDNDVSDNNNTGYSETLKLAFAVLAYTNERSESETSFQVIYSRCKPIADQILALALHEIDNELFNSTCDEFQITFPISGIWVGPVIAGVYGYRYTIDIRVFNNDFLYNPEHFD
jgi:hypothetical protein